MVKKCNREYNPTEDECFACKNKKECVEEYAESISKKNAECRFFREGAILHCSGVFDCSPRHSMTCRVIKKLKESQETTKTPCENFGMPYKEKEEKCILCDEKTFLQCEVFDILIKNPELTFESAQQIIKKQIGELRREFNGCYGKFAFESICWNNCEYSVRCLRESGIFPGERCKNYNQDGKFQETCSDCEFRNRCKIIWDNIQKGLKKEAEAKKMFMNFFSLKEIRDGFLTEEGE